ncbi:hypothetical protein ASPSYDRAFT_92388 [Aspergillus sydowii CBS 593.65]|uniref:DUF7703 domain-containing protein n=1 Tax=Aspergillus sydowii CBS 593.65 TaxID=1036612 RepID=A0A1L9T9U2_9EURO|nr:uncharacterized protein ASPSYDRAFT_92388 [Aspergillus sydowii CBS 593.65]OJJ56199.1 hypothetical protein ASPSYDRAFT_92388 [Aspergillus sydowii CBS 593.65]
MSSDSVSQDLTRQEEYAFTAFSAITLYNSIELIILCLATFKRYQGVYFWSLLITSCSLIVNTLGFILLFFVNVTPYVSVTIVLIGWYCMITGHSIVLWSRLHLVLHQPRTLRAILYLIIFDAIVLQIPTTVLLYGAVTPAVEDRFATGYNIIERIQLVVFCVQESLLSGIYIWETAKLLYLRPQRAHRIILIQLLAINVVILGLDVVVVVFQYAGLFSLQVVFKPVAYSIKLRLEYAILGRLVVFATGAQGSTSSGRSLTEPGPSWPAMVGVNDEYWRRGGGSSTSTSCRCGNS